MSGSVKAPRTAAFINTIRSTIYDVGEVVSEQIAVIASNVVREEEGKYFLTIANQMGKDRKPRLPEFEKVYWRPLSERTRKLKARHGLQNIKWLYGKKRFQTKTLQDFLGELPSSAVEKYFGKSSYSVGKPANLKNGTLTRIYLSSALTKPRIFFESSIKDGAGATMEDKISGIHKKLGQSNEDLRPIFEPMRMYFLKHKIPNAVNSALSRFNFSDYTKGAIKDVIFRHKQNPK